MRPSRDRYGFLSTIQKTPPKPGVLFAPAGANIGKGGHTGFACRVESVDLPGGISTSKLVFDGGPITVNADDLLKPRDNVQREAVEFLRRELAKGPRLVRQMETAAKDEGISPRTLRRAREKLGSRKSGIATSKA